MTSRPNREWFVYVIELDDAAGERANAKHPCVYVGQSVHKPDERFRQHKAGYKASKAAKRYGKWLRRKLYQRHNPLPSREAALAKEAWLAAELHRRGYTVFGGK